MGAKPFLLNLIQYLANSWSPTGDPSRTLVEEALLLSSITPKNVNPLQASDRAGCSPGATRGMRTAGEDTGDDVCNYMFFTM